MGTPPPLSRICSNSLDHLLVGRTLVWRDPTRPAPPTARVLGTAQHLCESCIEGIRDTGPLYRKNSRLPRRPEPLDPDRVGCYTQHDDVDLPAMHP